ncbi:hypothetical protein WFC_00084 [Escherichia phage vB_EcoM_WFC]|uniref:Uncharacterized protein n=1 Tax=Escherichia phage vB_EcoM_WFC TaxID=2508193 RepID=A0A482MV92_9CAUD|nr:hypothetical protein HOV52_gp084 [Escherichia phage vB_EcoM_WFC]QBQ77476.1 hypothetical protein WFC_00084 [Escherichia phage vB_EcoM_WFC]
MINTYKVFFVKCTSSIDDQFTAGKNYPVISESRLDIILNDHEIYEPMPATAFDVIGHVRIKTNVDTMHDPLFKKQIKNAMQDFCAAMFKYYK